MSRRVVLAENPHKTTPNPQLATSYLSGVYRGGYASGNGRFAEAQAFGAWRGSAVTLVTDFLSSSTWATISGSNTLQMAGLQGARQAGAQVDLAVPMLPADTSTTLTAGAAGTYTANFTALASALVSYGLGDIYIRLGWEMNASSGFRWALNGNYQSGNPSYGSGNAAQGVAEYTSYWALVVAAMKAVAPALKFVFCPINGWSGTGPAPGTMLPDITTVDVIGIDLYDQHFGAYPPQNSTTWATAWTSYRTQAYGLDYWRGIALTNGKKLALPEWGLNKRGGSTEFGGLDNLSFIANVHAYMRDIAQAGFAAYASYFDYTASDGDHRLFQYAGQSPTIFPNGSAQYRALVWGS
jgi:hypothetical protein